MLQTQLITIDLDGITAADYLAHFRDADAPIEASRLQAVGVNADPLGDTVDVILRWQGPPPNARTAASAAGFQLTGDVVGIRSRVQVRSRRRTARPTLVAAAA
jgi:hypothetical protein